MPSGMARSDATTARAAWALTTVEVICRGCKTDRLEDAVVADALADREQDDCDERGGGDQQQHGVECVDEEQQLIREIAGFAGRLRVERCVERERGDHHRAGERDRGCEEKRPASSCEEVFEPEPDRQRQHGSGDGARQP